MGIVIAPWGKKSIFPCYYIHLQPGNRSFLACWLYRPEPNVQKAIRDRLVTDRQWFERILTTIAKTGQRWPLEGDHYKRVPAWYDKEHPASELLKHKDWLLHAPLLDKDVLDEWFAEKTVSLFNTICPFNQRLWAAIKDMMRNG
jgi:uncharacterized protein (TIGR02453 family)